MIAEILSHEVVIEQRVVTVEKQHDVIGHGHVVVRFLGPVPEFRHDIIKP